MWTRTSLGFCFSSLLWVMALHHCFPSPRSFSGCSLLMDAHPSSSRACTLGMWKCPERGKAVSASSCLSSQCFDLLTRSCVKCSDLFKENTTEPASAVPTSALEPTHPSMDLPSTLLIFGVPAAGVFILILATLLGFLACKLGKWRRKRKAADNEAQANVEATSPLPIPGCQDPVVMEGDVTLAPAPCQHLNGGLKLLNRPGKTREKQRPCCQGDADGDIILLSTMYPRHEECNHGFPLPATELGATALVTTKTTQNCA